MIVVKIGGGCLSDEATIAHIVGLAERRLPGQLMVVSALQGVTDQLYSALRRAVVDEASVGPSMAGFRQRHLAVASHLLGPCPSLDRFQELLESLLRKIERLLFGLSFTREITPRLADAVVSSGERLSAELLAYVLSCRGVQAVCLPPEEIGLITNGRYGDAQADMAATTRHFQERVRPRLASGELGVMPGFYGVSRQGEITTLGRGGSDYAAAVAAAALGARRLEVWKDVAGFLSADPRAVANARLVPQLSYDEAAELSYFGAKILHPRTVEPLRAARIPIEVRNTLDPDAPGSVIHARRRRAATVIKSVAQTRDVGLLKVHASAVGVEPGVLARVARAVTDAGINIKSVVTSQTSISLLLAEKDLETARRAVAGLTPRPYRRLEPVADLALVGVVGEGLADRQGIAARVFGAVAEVKVNVEAIAFGPSPVALYFLVREQALEPAVRAIHGAFFK